MSLYKCPNVISIVLDWNNSQNGMLIGFIGIVSALLQGGYVRRSMSKTGEAVMARRGVLSCALGLILLAVLPQLVSSRTTLAIRVLYTAAICLGFTSATVVNALTAHASLQCDESIDEVTGKPLVTDPELAKGKALGKFRSSGQLGRAIGPLLGMCFVPPSLPFFSFSFFPYLAQFGNSFRPFFLILILLLTLACASYWTVGPSITYATAAVAMFVLSSRMRISKA